MLLQVALHENCIAFGGRDEYPDGQIGEEGVPPRRVDGILRTKAENEKDESIRARAIATYEESTQFVDERLRYVKFAEHFTGMSAGERPRKERKTDDHKGMWIPEWLLKSVPEVSEAEAN